MFGCVVICLDSFSHLFHMENIATAFILLNRFTAVFYPLFHDRIWVHLLAPAILLTIVGPLPLTLGSLSRPYMIYPTLEAGVGSSNYTFTIVQNAALDPVLNKDAQIAALSALVFCAICIVLNVATLVQYRRHNSGTAPVTQRRSSAAEQRRIESRLTIYAISTFFSQLAVAVNVILICANSRAFVGSWEREVIFLAVWNWTPLVNVRDKPPSRYNELGNG